MRSPGKCVRKICRISYWKRTGQYGFDESATRWEATSNLKSESNLHFTAAKRGNVQDPAVQILRHPSFPQRDFQQLRPDCASKVRPPLAPIHARKRETTPQHAGCVNVHSQRFQAFGSARCEVVRSRVSRILRQPSHGPDAIVKRYAKRACDMVVTSPRGTQRTRRVWDECAARSAGKNAQCFQSSPNVWAFQAVVAMLPLGEHFYQAIGH